MYLVRIRFYEFYEIFAHYIYKGGDPPPHIAIMVNLTTWLPMYVALLHPLQKTPRQNQEKKPSPPTAFQQKILSHSSQDFRLLCIMSQGGGSVTEENKIDGLGT